jgi:hypothetical protein
LFVSDLQQVGSFPYIIFLQKKERELNALKLELMSSNIQSGTTRKKHFFESDV